MTTVTTLSVAQQEPEETARQFLVDTLDLKELPQGSLHDILKDGILLCELIKRFSPNECIIKNEGRTKFAYHDNIGQFLRVAEDLHIPQSDLFQTVDLLEGKRMQSVISCLLAIKRIMSERKISPAKSSIEFPTTGRKRSSKNMLLLASAYPTLSSSNTCNLLQLQMSGRTSPNSVRSSSSEKSPLTTSNYIFSAKKKEAPQVPTKESHHDKMPEWQKNLSPRRATETRGTKANQQQTNGYVRSQVQMIITNNLSVPAEPKAKIRRFSSSESKLDEMKPPSLEDKTSPIALSKVTSAQQAAPKRLLAPPMPKPSKSTPLVAATNVTVTTAKGSLDQRTAAENNLKYYTSMESANRKTSLKKMGSCAITVESDDGTTAVYALGKSIGKGQFGEVFGGLNMDTGEYVAIKRIRRNQMDCDDMNEVGVLQHLDNDHIVRYKGFAKDKEFLNIILEYVEMGSLHNNIKAFGKFPEKLAASYTYKILSGLNYLHSEDVIHCDLKAANILTTKTGGLKLTDFGVSLSLKMKDDENTGEPAGTPNWMAPEVIKFAGASAKSDIWSLGCTIVEMLTGKPPYASMPSFAALYRIVEDDEPPIPKSLKLSKEGMDFLKSCFRKDPDDRPSALELMQSKWMEPFYRKDTSVLLSPPPSPENTLRRSRSEEMDPYMRHQLIDYQTTRKDHKCSGCYTKITDLWAKSCQDCRQSFHPQCIHKASSCTGMKHTSQERRLTPLAPLSSQTSSKKKNYLPVIHSPSNTNHRHYLHYKTEGYPSSKASTGRPLASSIMT
ncbi:Serine/threonine-protein kinase sepA [Choanephora cucurbitarum]|uniref:Serine/threonine-protein kinase sepA n=1 Tax=Choanephora cucurbitarum TaxID=101091 RepID=A0A1C7N6L1_9FUNG|nr:Serine/threonine-protein kinase sepA [Choanephora cucurbitarum]